MKKFQKILTNLDIDQFKDYYSKHNIRDTVRYFNTSAEMITKICKAINFRKDKNQIVTLRNIGTREVGFIPFKENFTVEIGKEDSITIETKIAEEAMYYLLQANKDLEVSL